MDIARVSTDGQTLDAQIAALKAAGAKRMFSEKQSGAKTDRAALAKALGGAERGGRSAGHPARSARQEHQGPSERLGDRL
jgi:Resolvase, N terminal domain